MAATNGRSGGTKANGAKAGGAKTGGAKTRGRSKPSGKSAGKSAAKSSAKSRRAESGAVDARLVMGARSLLSSNGDENVEDAFGHRPPPIEGLNRSIVEILQEDGRASLSSIAEVLGVSEATVRSRVSRMRKANLINFIAVINPLALGFTAWAMLGIRVAQGASADDVARYFSDCPEVVYVMRVAARFDLLAEIVCETPDDLRDFLDRHCYGAPDVASVEPMIGLGLYKSLFKWDRPIVAGNGSNHGGNSNGSK